MDIFVNQLIQFYLNNARNLRPLKSTHYTVLYAQNGVRIVTIDYVTSLYPVYSRQRSPISVLTGLDVE